MKVNDESGSFKIAFVEIVIILKLILKAIFDLNIQQMSSASHLFCLTSKAVKDCLQL